MEPPNHTVDETTLALRVEKHDLKEKHQNEMIQAISKTTHAQEIGMECILSYKSAVDELAQVKLELVDCKRKLYAFESESKRAKITSFCEKDLFPDGTDHKYKVLTVHSNPYKPNQTPL